MDLHLLHTLTGIFIVLSLIPKIFIHYYLDNMNDIGLGLNSVMLMPLHYLMPYRSSVNSEHKKQKYLCNFLLVISGISLCGNILFGILII